MGSVNSAYIILYKCEENILKDPFIIQNSSYVIVFDLQYQFLMAENTAVGMEERNETKMNKNVFTKIYIAIYLWLRQSTFIYKKM